MGKRKCPCNGCSDRALGCHGVCTSYADWAAENKKIAKWARDSKPPVISRGSFLGTSPKPGKKRKYKK